MAGGGYLPFASPSIRAANQLEHCIVTAERAVRFAEKLKTLGYLPNNLLPLERSRSSLRNVRGAIAHLENEILGGGDQAGPYMLQMKASQAVIIARGTATSLPYEELAQILIQLRACVEQIIDRDSQTWPSRGPDPVAAP